MNASDSLYSELKPDIQAVASPLFDFSEKCLLQRDNFLPHAVVLTDDGEIKYVGAAPDTNSDYTNSTEILPILHQGLRQQAKEGAVRAIGVAENVIITPEGQKTTNAIKVLFEHKRGLTVAMYLPFAKKTLEDYSFGSIFFDHREARDQRLAGKQHLKPAERARFHLSS
jgi:hypothetical protein